MLQVNPKWSQVEYYTILEAVLQECLRQDEKWGVQNHSPHEWISIETEEVGEAAQEANRITWGGKAGGDYVAELVQVAAVAVQAVKSYYRQQGETQ